MEGSPEYQMEAGVKRADFVLVLGSARYKERAETPGSGVAIKLQCIFIHFILFETPYLVFENCFTHILPKILSM
jgi:hypothetical protein